MRPRGPRAGLPISPLAGFELVPAKASAHGLSAKAAQDAYLFRSVQYGKCLDADLNTIGRNGTKVQLWTCDNTAAQQAFYLDQIPEGYTRLRNAHSGRYLDADLLTINQNGTKVQLWDYIAGQKNQWWGAARIPEGFDRIGTPASPRWLDADSVTAGRNGTKVQLWQFVAGNKNQWWQ